MTSGDDTIITRDPQYRQTLLEKLRQTMGVGTRRTGIHVSDLILCTRKAWAERVSEFTQNVSDQTILIWLRGLSHEELAADGIQQVRSGYCFPCSENWALGDFYFDGDDPSPRCPRCQEVLLTGTIDWVIDDGSPVEFKSTMKSSRKHVDEGEMAWFVDQVKSYMAMHGKQEGRIAVLHNMGDYSRADRDVRGDGPQAELVVYTVRWRSQHDPKNWLGRLAWRKARVEDDAVTPPLDENSPAHPFICEYCIVGEMLPDGSECEKWPWELAPSGQYVRKGSGKGQVIQLDDMLGELIEMSQRQTEAELEASGDVPMA